MPETSAARTYVGVPAIGNFYSRLLGDVDRMLADSPSLPREVSLSLQASAAAFFQPDWLHYVRFRQAGMGEPVRQGRGKEERVYRVLGFEVLPNGSAQSLLLRFDIALAA